MSLSSTSSSSLSVSSLELGSYQDSLEAVLAWLLEAEETLLKHGEIGKDVSTVKTQFHQHEVSRISMMFAKGLLLIITTGEFGKIKE